ncbi:GAF domain-containing protein [Ohtaekwangia koreensis]|uniref:GAF domain-containing protein n=1 Tax=Ohtaekwangia koreensis TaxID=688867 RepID=A0A1T5MHB9_9BACT|nr:GAF domain-containing protein [Ohtaekwangia koreensis]SKC87308.1 GAF domain-containing protein [Ohtaekwangia koreensis]
MAIFLKKRQFQLKSLSLFLIPVFLLLVLLCYLAARSPEKLASERFPAVTIFLALLVLYVILLIPFTKKTRTRILTIGTSIADLAAGKFNNTVTVKEQDEIADIALGINTLKDDLMRKTEFAEEIRKGNLDAAYKPNNADDLLGHSLLKLKENLLVVKEEDQKRNWTTDGLAKFVEVLRSNKNIDALAHDITKSLVNLLNANQGAIFILNDDHSHDKHLEMLACYAFNRTKHLTKKVAIGEGLIGQTFLEKETLYLKEVPEDFVRITSGLGEANPKNLLITPLKVNEDVVGIVELASFKPFQEHEIAFVEKIGENIAHTILSFRTNENTKRLLDESHQQAENMRAQEEELRQNQEELQATQEEISRKYNALFKQLAELNYQSKFDQLKSINSTKKRNIEYYFDIIRNQIRTFAENKMVVSAVNDFKKAFAKIHEGISDEKLATIKDSLREYYANEFIPRIKDNTDQLERVEHYFPEEIRADVLQYLYISNNPHPTGQKSLLNRSEDESEYSKVHAHYHPVMRSFLEKFGYYDIFLIDHITGEMVYSVFKEIDFATSLLTGLYSKTNFGRVVKEAIESTDKNFVKLADFEPYDPSYHTPASFIACPIYDGDEKAGILVFQMPINKINQILTGDANWHDDGLGESGETLMIGSDYKLRSIARELMENKKRYLSGLKKIGYSDSITLQIDKMNTSILLETIKLTSVDKALQGETGTQIEKNKHNIEMLNAFAPLNIPDVHWIILSTMKEEEASMRINDLRKGA